MHLTKFPGALSEPCLKYKVRNMIYCKYVRSGKKSSFFMAIDNRLSSNQLFSTWVRNAGHCRSVKKEVHGNI